MSDFWITPGSLLYTKDTVIGSGENFKKVVKDGTILMFLSRERYAEVDPPTLFVYRYIQDNRKCCIICSEEQFYKFFEVIYLGKVHHITKPKCLTKQTKLPEE